MGIPRKTDVSRHLSSKLRLVTRESAATDDDDKTGLNSLADDLSAAVNSAQSSPASGGDQ